MLKNVPSLFPIRFIFFELLIFGLYISLSRFSPVLHSFCNLIIGLIACRISLSSVWLSCGCSTWLLNLIILSTGLLLLLSILSHLVNLCAWFGRLLVLCFDVNVLALWNLLLLLLLHFLKLFINLNMNLNRF